MTAIQFGLRKKTQPLAKVSQWSESLKEQPRSGSKAEAEGHDGGEESLHIGEIDPGSNGEPRHQTQRVVIESTRLFTFYK